MAVTFKQFYGDFRPFNARAETTYEFKNRPWDSWMCLVATYRSRGGELEIGHLYSMSYDMCYRLSKDTRMFVQQVTVLVDLLNLHIDQSLSDHWSKDERSDWLAGLEGRRYWGEYL